MGPFERHGIHHLSPSSLRLYREQPAAWVCTYLMHLRGDAGPAAWRGQAVEAGLDVWLFGDTFDAALDAANRRWHEQAMGEVTDKGDGEYANIPGFLMQATNALAGHPPVLTKQSKISIELEGIEVPVVGYTDYMFPDYGLDLKTTLRMPPLPRQEHVDQMAVYMTAKKKPFKLLYVTPKRHELYDVTDAMAAESMAQMTNGAKAIRHLLSNSHDAQDALNFFYPDYSSFYWSAETIAAVRKVHHHDGEPSDAD